MNTPNVQNCLEIIQEQRHAFINHLQVISGYLQLNRAEDAKSYIDSVALEMAQFSQFSRIKCPELALSLLYVMSMGAKDGIKMELAVESGFAGCSALDSKIGQMVERLFVTLRESALFSGGAEKSLRITLHTQQEQYFCGFVFPAPNSAALAALERGLADLDAQFRPYAVWQSRAPGTGFLEIALVFSGDGAPVDPSNITQVKHNVL